jgi:hypothetical protein
MTESEEKSLIAELLLENLREKKKARDGLK